MKTGPQGPGGSSCQQRRISPASLSGSIVGTSRRRECRIPRYLQDGYATLAQPVEANDTHFTTWACSLASNAVDDYSPVIVLARKAVDSEPENAQYLTGLGAVLFRAGQFDEAQKTLLQSLDKAADEKTSPSYAHYFLAMTEHRRGKTEEAKRHLQTANELAESELATSPVWNRRLTLELLRKEAQQMLAAGGRD